MMTPSSTSTRRMGPAQRVAVSKQPLEQEWTSAPTAHPHADHDSHEQPSSDEASLSFASFDTEQPTTGIWMTPAPDMHSALVHSHGPPGGGDTPASIYSRRLDLTPMSRALTNSLEWSKQGGGITSQLQQRTGVAGHRAAAAAGARKGVSGRSGIPSHSAIVLGDATNRQYQALGMPVPGQFKQEPYAGHSPEISIGSSLGAAGRQALQPAYASTPQSKGGATLDMLVNGHSNTHTPTRDPEGAKRHPTDRYTSGTSPQEDQEGDNRYADACTPPTKSQAAADRRQGGSWDVLWSSPVQTDGAPTPAPPQSASPDDSNSPPSNWALPVVQDADVLHASPPDLSLQQPAASAAQGQAQPQTTSSTSQQPERSQRSIADLLFGTDSSDEDVSSLPHMPHSNMLQAGPARQQEHVQEQEQGMTRLTATERPGAQQAAVPARASRQPGTTPVHVQQDDVSSSKHQKHRQAGVLVVGEPGAEQAGVSGLVTPSSVSPFPGVDGGMSQLHLRLAAAEEEQEWQAQQLVIAEQHQQLLSRQLESAQEEKTRLQQHCAQLAESLEQARSAASSAQAQTASLEEQLRTALAGAGEAAAAAEADLHRAVSQLEAQLADAQQQVQEAEQGCQQLQQQMDAYLQRAEAAEAAVERMSEQLRHAQEQVEFLTTSRDELLLARDELMRDVEAERARLTEQTWQLQDQLGDAHKAAEACSADAEAARQEAGELRVALAQRQQELQVQEVALQQQHQADALTGLLQEQVSQLEDALSVVRSECDAHKQQASDAVHECAVWQQQARAAQEECEQHRQQADSAAEECASLRQLLGEVQAEKAGLQQQSHAAQEACDELRQQVWAAQEECAVYQQHFKAAQEECDALRLQFSSLQQDCERYQQQAMAAQEEHQQLQQHVDAVESGHHAHQQQLRSLRDECEGLRQRLRSALAEADTDKEQARVAQAECSALQQRVSAAQEECEVCRTQISCATEEHDILRHQLNAVQAECDAAHQQVAALRTELISARARQEAAAAAGQQADSLGGRGTVVAKLDGSATQVMELRYAMRQLEQLVVSLAQEVVPGQHSSLLTQPLTGSTPRKSSSATALSRTAAPQPEFDVETAWLRDTLQEMHGCCLNTTTLFKASVEALRSPSVYATPLHTTPGPKHAKKQAQRKPDHTSYSTVKYALENASQALGVAIQSWAPEAEQAAGGAVSSTQKLFLDASLSGVASPVAADQVAHDVQDLQHKCEGYAAQVQLLEARLAQAMADVSAAHADIAQQPAAGTIGPRRRTLDQHHYEAEPSTGSDLLMPEQPKAQSGVLHYAGTEAAVEMSDVSCQCDQHMTWDAACQCDFTQPSRDTLDQLADARDKLADVHEQLITARAHLSDARAELCDTRDQLSEQHQRHERAVARLQQHVLELQGEAEHMSVRHEAAAKQVNQLRSERDALVDHVLQLETSLASVQQEASQSSIQLSGARAELVAAKEQVQRLEAQLQHAQHDAAARQEAVAGLRAELTAQEAQLQAHVERLERQVKKQVQVIRRLEDELSQQQQEALVRGQEAAAGSAETALAAAQQVLRLQEQVAQAKAGQEASLAQHQQLLSAHQLVLQQLGEAQQQAAALSREKAAWAQESRDLHVRLSGAESAVQAQASQVLQVQAELSQLQSAYEAAIDQLEATRQLLSDTSTSYADQLDTLLLEAQEASDERYRATVEVLRAQRDEFEQLAADTQLRLQEMMSAAPSLPASPGRDAVATQTSPQQHQAAAARAAALMRELHEVKDALTAAEARCNALQRIADDARHAASATLHTHDAAQQQQLQHQAQQLVAREAALQEAQTSLSALQEQCVQLSSAVSEAQQEARETSKQLRQAEQYISDLRHALDDARSHARAQEEGVAEVQQRVSQADAFAEEWQVKWQEVQSDNECLMVEAQQARDQLLGTQQDLARTAVKLAAAVKRCKELEQQAELVQGSMAQLSELQAEVQELRQVREVVAASQSVQASVLKEELACEQQHAATLHEALQSALACAQQAEADAAAQQGLREQDRQQVGAQLAQMEVQLKALHVQLAKQEQERLGWEQEKLQVLRQQRQMQQERDALEKAHLQLMADVDRLQQRGRADQQGGQLAVSPAGAGAVVAHLPGWHQLELLWQSSLKPDGTGAGQPVAPGASSTPEQLLSWTVQQLKQLKENNHKMAKVLKRISREGSVLHQLEDVRRENQELACKYTAAQLSSQQLQRAMHRLSAENEELTQLVTHLQARSTPHLVSADATA